MPNTPGQEEVHSFRDWASNPHTPTRGSPVPNETGNHFSQHHEHRPDSGQTAYGNTQYDAGYGDGLATPYSVYDVSPHPDASVVPPDSIYQRHDDETELLQESQWQQQAKGTFKPVNLSTVPLTSQSLDSPPVIRSSTARQSQQRPSSCACWPWRWRKSWNMYLCLLFGVACAASHHFYYLSLDGRPATDQIKMMRYGTMLAFGAKAGLSAAVIVAFRQRVWTTVRKRFMTVGALDALFSATEDLQAVTSWEMVQSAKVAALLAAYVWLAPLVVVLTSNTLLVVPRKMTILTSCPEVRTLNLTFEETYEWRQPPKIDRLFEIPLSLWNTTKEPENDTPGWFDYYTAPSPSFQNTATIGSFLEEAVMRRNAPIETCGTGWNCSFEIQFVAPAYKCTELGNGVDSIVNNLTQESGSIAPPFNMDVLLPRGKFTYYAFTSGGEYSTTQMKEVGIGGRPTTDPPFPKHLGAFRTEPIIWLGYVTLADALAKANDIRGNLPSVPSNPSDPAWNTSFVPHIFACENYESNYTVRINYTGAAQTTTVTNVTYLRPVINTTYTPHIDANDGTADNVTATPTDNYILPTSVPQYRRTAAYHSLGFMLRDQINGTVGIGDDRDLVNPIANTKAIQTSRLLDFGNNYFPYPDIQRRIQKFYEDIILSVLGHPQFASVVWAAKSGEQSGVTFDAPDANQPSLLTTDQQRAYLYPCTKFRMALVYKFNARLLWIVYSISIALAVMGVVVGALALRENGAVVRDTKFSSIVAATRGSGLGRARWTDRFDGGASGGGDTVPEEVKGWRMGYGVVDAGAGDGRLEVVDGAGGRTVYGFGFEGDVRQLRRTPSLVQLTTLGK
ncbi:hypothetical protein GE21DRAFT_5576 [Neurospora crassa]|uniref:Formylmethionine deformylase-like protein n=1 Tax=Neurospora crassa (strain ATCC 24698 / 74-OR23-1A / CBS 708.71 / DSM 1257 / FGSC 987) TaxID=367110 RepID=Q7S9H6_NEUCR|nr:hypothetical protein NCU06557 [Neurospora crassa OR74A]EAA33028.3 hypothetical protein NCU06557 [Neurospora crassa OR74A]KHE80529.1 hypothetical protein GE21DRAFT_5576 [Neurospora crassa]|eukprot:XP_962264.3 hypothetical protein NCU06557 [Neurospora crassa OR74A]